MSDADISDADASDADMSDSEANTAENRPTRITITGTPGTGKTTVTNALAELGVDTPVIHLNDEIRDHDLWTERDADRNSLVTDLEAVEEYLGDWSGILESHLAHRFDADRVIVLRCEPSVLERRLLDRGETAAKARENAESEALDVILSEAVEHHGVESVYEIDTTDRDPAAVAEEIRAVIDNERAPSAGTVDFTGYLVE